LGDFLKELDLTEGRSTGIPTIQEEMQENGSPRATIETNEERNFIIVFIPIHEGCEETVVLNGTQGVTKDVTKELSERQLLILEMIDDDSFVTIPEMSLKTCVATRPIKRDIETLQTLGVLRRKGGRKNGEWERIGQGDLSHAKSEDVNEAEDN
jgi:ATP-dependent DNA helicase RecG